MHKLPIQFNYDNTDKYDEILIRKNNRELLNFTKISVIT